jgi:hypothetical protein
MVCRPKRRLCFGRMQDRCLALMQDWLAATGARPDGIDGRSRVCNPGNRGVRRSRGRDLAVGARAEPAVSQAEVDHPADCAPSAPARIVGSARARLSGIPGVAALVDRGRPLSLLVNSLLKGFLQPLQLQDQRHALRTGVMTRAMVVQRLGFAVVSKTVGGFQCGPPATTSGALSLTVVGAGGVRTPAERATRWNTSSRGPKAIALPS